MSLCRTWLDDWHPVQSCTTITIDGRTLHGTDPGVGFGVERFDGWTTGVDYSGGPVPYETADGGVMGQVTRRGRLLTIEGVIVGHDGPDLQRRVEDFGGILAAPRTGELVVRESWLDLERMVPVTRMRAPQVTVETWTEAIFTLDLEAAISTRLDAAESALTLQPGKAGSVTNIGNLPAALTLLMRGPLTNPSITVAGQQWRYEGSVATGRTLTVDMSRRDVRDPATNTGSRRQAFGVWPAVPTGATAVSAGGTGSGTLELRWRSTWS